MSKTAREMNRAPGEEVWVLPVSLCDARQMYFLRAIADEGILGQTPQEVAAWFIMEGILTRQRSQGRIDPPESWEGYEVGIDLQSLKNRMCTGKHRHETMEGAKRQLKVGRRHTKNIQHSLKMSAYRCPFCDGFHVGHSGGKKK